MGASGAPGLLLDRGYESRLVMVQSASGRETEVPLGVTVGEDGEAEERDTG